MLKGKRLKAKGERLRPSSRFSGSKAEGIILRGTVEMTKAKSHILPK
jgi:hypothetical protein